MGADSSLSVEIMISRRMVAEVERALAREWECEWVWVWVGLRDARVRKGRAGEGERGGEGVRERELLVMVCERTSQSRTERGTVGEGWAPGVTSLIRVVRFVISVSSIPAPATWLPLL